MGLHTLPGTLLMSYHYHAKTDIAATAQGMRVIGDSGAFSARYAGAEVKEDDLGKWAVDNRQHLWWVACLDVKGDQPATRRSWHYLNDKYGLQTVPSIHYGDAPSMLDYYAKRGCDFVGLGGVAGESGGPRIMRWLIQVFKYARANHPSMRFHGWGMTGQATKNLPFYTVDSSSWSSSYRYGTMTLRNPERGYKTLQYRTDGKEAYRRDVAQLLRRHYDVNPADVALSTPATRMKLIQVASISQALYEENMRNLHAPGITAPTWGLNPRFDAPAGPHVALAEGTDRHLRAVADLVRENR